MSRNSFLKGMFLASSNSPLRQTSRTGLGVRGRRNEETIRRQYMQPGAELCALFGVAPKVEMSEEERKAERLATRREENAATFEAAKRLFAKREVK